MRYVIATAGAAFIFAAVFALSLLLTNWFVALARLQRDGPVGLLRENIPGALLAGLAAALSFAGTVRHYWKKDLERKAPGSPGPD